MGARLMLALVLRGFLQRKLRVLLTGIAVALGVALMAGTYVLTDTINQSFAGIFQTANRGHDIVITPTQVLGRNTGSETTPISGAMLARVRATAGVGQAAGSIFSPGTFLDVNRKRLTKGGAPAFVASEVHARFNSFTPVQAASPRARMNSRSTKPPHPAPN
jgi:putative ABC transport system permease protein